jgi:AraC family transcriptional regulator, transcriptional activator FtrA
MTAPSPPPARHRIVTVLVDGMGALEPAVAYDFLGYDRRYLHPGWYRYTACSPGAQPVRIGGATMTVPNDLSALRRADTVLIPGWCSTDRRPPPELLDGIRRAHDRGARVVSFCTGALVLAEAGLLDGRRATTHWSFGAELGRRHPAIHLDPTVLYIDDGDVLTSAGAAAAIDLSLHLIRRDFGAEIANTVARAMVVPAHRDGGQAQYVEAPVDLRSPPAEDPVARAMDWAAARLDEPLPVERLAAQALLSPRQFTRQFKARTGTSPHQWVLTQRTTLAQRLLETTDAPVERVAHSAGFATAAALRLHFQRTLHTSPQAYRRCFHQGLSA